VAGTVTRQAARDLSSDARSALHARLEVRRNLGRTLSQGWPVVAFLVAFTAGAAVVVITVGRNPFGFMVGGFVVASGVWATILFLVLFGGVAPRMMGVTAEQWTSSDLRKLKRRGWQLINGVRQRDSDIDHVAIGPGGVLVVETKWSSDPWPTGFDESNSYIARTLRGAIQQTSTNRARVADLLRSVPGEAVQGVLVLWNTGGSGEGPSEPFRKGNVWVVSGSSFGRWLANLRDTTPRRFDAEEALRTVISHLEQEKLTAGEAALAGRPTVFQSIWRYFLEPVLAFYAVLGLLLAATASHRLDVLVPELVLSPLCGLVLMRWRRVRPAAIVWLGTATALAIALAVVL
jgi:hypothetical protein